MNRRTIVLAIAGLAIAAFAIAASFYTSRQENAPPPAPIISAPSVQPDAPAITADAETPAAEVLADAEAPAPAAPRWDVYVREHSPVIGPRNAPVTIVEFFDPSCEACRAFYPIVKQIMAQYPNDVRLVLRYTPLHEGSEEAVRILETARRQNVFEPVLEALFVEQPQWATHGGPQLERAWAAAEAAGLDQARARAAMQSPRITAALNQDIADATTLGVRGTPTFFVNGEPLPSFGPQQLYDLVRAEVEAANN
ncbi:MAG: thioredoxin domain-containing protein [Hyphomonadaceae bacterium]|nr:thioredoxin domain-containing protein [Hyphomonadaceae bacterium]